MVRGSLFMASFGLALGFLLWTVPGLVGAAALPHVLFPRHTPTLSQALETVERAAPPRPSLPDALLQLIGAEAEAFEVVGGALQQPLPADLAMRADHAGARVLDAVMAYIRAASAAVNHTPGN